MEYNGNHYKLIRHGDPQVGDLIVNCEEVQLEITEDTDFLQEEVYPMLQNFGSRLFRPV